MAQLKDNHQSLNDIVADMEEKYEGSDDEGYDVKVYVYDLSRGMASVYSKMILGIEMEYVYHTSVVAYGKEIFLSQGIQQCVPGTTKYGQPIEVIDMGKTYISSEITDDFIEELKSREDQKWSDFNYDLFENNCNHFTDSLLQFLVGSNLESRILHLPDRVLASPGGLALKQMLSGFRP